MFIRRTVASKKIMTTNPDVISELASLVSSKPGARKRGFEANKFNILICLAKGNDVDPSCAGLVFERLVFDRGLRFPTSEKETNQT